MSESKDGAQNNVAITSRLGSETSSDQLSPLPQRIKTKKRGPRGPLQINEKTLPNASQWCSLQRDSKADESNAAHHQNPTLSLSSESTEGSQGVKKQKPSKRARKRMRKRLEKMRFVEEEFHEANVIASESGYETTGDYRASAANTPMQSPLKSTTLGEGSENFDSKGQAKLGQQIEPVKTILTGDAACSDRIHSRSDSASSANSINTSEISLKKLLKDLHRCDVSIARYQAMLTENCEVGLKQLHRMFSTLRSGLNAREEDLIQELNATRQAAATILQRRKETASYIRQVAEKVNSLEEVQVLELKQQIKQFVMDRKVDEEIGTVARFQADPDDLLPQVMGFGKVMNVQYLYTSWEENPEERIERSKHRSTLFPSLSSPTCSGAEIDGALKPEQDSAFIESSDEFQKKEPSPPSTEAMVVEDSANRDTPISQSSSVVEKSTQTEVRTELNRNKRVPSNSQPAPMFRHGYRSNASRKPFVPFIPRLAAARAHTQKYLPETRPSLKSSSATKAKETKSLKSVKTMNEPENTVSPSSKSEAKSASVPVELDVSKASNKQTTQESLLPPDRESSDQLQSESLKSVKTNEPENTVSPSSKSEAKSASVPVELDVSKASNKQTTQESLLPPDRESSDQLQSESLKSAKTNEPENTVSPSSKSEAKSASVPVELHVSKASNKQTTQESLLPPDRESSDQLQSEKQRELTSEEQYGRSKYSLEELVTIQDRVRASLQRQGVYLYDPLTGEGPSIQPQVEGEECVDLTLRKKKTPTQLRRERKKRQKERERIQRDLEKKVREESENTASQMGSHASEEPVPSASNAQITTGKSTNDSSSDSIQNSPLLEAHGASGEQRTKKKRKKSKLKSTTSDPDFTSLDGTLSNESCSPVSTDSENEPDASDEHPTPDISLATKEPANEDEKTAKGVPEMDTNDQERTAASPPRFDDTETKPVFDVNHEIQGDEETGIKGSSLGEPTEVVVSEQAANVPDPSVQSEGKTSDTQEHKENPTEDSNTHGTSTESPSGEVDSNDTQEHEESPAEDSSVQGTNTESPSGEIDSKDIQEHEENPTEDSNTHSTNTESLSGEIDSNDTQEHEESPAEDSSAQGTDSESPSGEIDSKDIQEHEESPAEDSSVQGTNTESPSGEIDSKDIQEHEENPTEDSNTHGTNTESLSGEIDSKDIQEHEESPAEDSNTHGTNTESLSGEIDSNDTQEHEESPAEDSSAQGTNTESPSREIDSKDIQEHEESPAEDSSVQGTNTESPSGEIDSKDIQEHEENPTEDSNTHGTNTESLSGEIDSKDIQEHEESPAEDSNTHSTNTESLSGEIDSNDTQEHEESPAEDSSAQGTNTESPSREIDSKDIQEHKESPGSVQGTQIESPSGEIDIQEHEESPAEDSSAQGTQIESPSDETDSALVPNAPTKDTTEEDIVTTQQSAERSSRPASQSTMLPPCSDTTDDVVTIREDGEAKPSPPEDTTQVPTVPHDTNSQNTHNIESEDALAEPLENQLDIAVTNHSPMQTDDTSTLEMQPIHVLSNSAPPEDLPPEVSANETDTRDSAIPPQEDTPDCASEGKESSSIREVQEAGEPTITSELPLEKEELAESDTRPVASETVEKKSLKTEATAGIQTTFTDTLSIQQQADTEAATLVEQDVIPSDKPESLSEETESQPQDTESSPPDSSQPPPAPSTAPSTASVPHLDKTKAFINEQEQPAEQAMDETQAKFTQSPAENCTPEKELKETLQTALQHEE